MSKSSDRVDGRLEPFRRKMEATIDNFQKELVGIRAGRASAALLEPVKVEAYGSQMQISHVASVSVPDARMIMVNVWDKELVKHVEKAIREMGIGLNPSIEGQVIKVPIAPLSEERRQELSKLAARYSEDSKVALRNVRREAMDFVKNLEKDGEIGEDEMHKLIDNIQDVTNEYTKLVDVHLANKQKDIMSI
ncbi:MAG: ribosome recycling factor [Holosporales bacterium]|jgi:ribosome recycling factor|nr:ribosome recycling factor [Holosporales bacterium]